MAENEHTERAALQCPNCLAHAGRYIGANAGQVVGTYQCAECDLVWRVKEASGLHTGPHLIHAKR